MDTIGDIDSGGGDDVDDYQLPDDQLLAGLVANQRKLNESVETMTRRIGQLKLKDIDSRSKLADKWCDLYINLLRTYGQYMQNESNRYMHNEAVVTSRLWPLADQLTVATDWINSRKKSIRQQTTIWKRQVNRETIDGLVDFTDIDTDLDGLSDCTAVPDLPNVLKFYQTIINELYCFRDIYDKQLSNNNKSVPLIANQTQDIVVNIVDDRDTHEEYESIDLLMDSKTVINSSPVNDIKQLIDNYKQPIDYMMDSQSSMAKTTDDETQQVITENTKTLGQIGSSLLSTIVTTDDRQKLMNLSSNSSQTDPIIIEDNKLMKEVNNENSNYCPICGQRISYDDDSVVKTCCGHWFHNQCIDDQYLPTNGRRRQLICPQCRLITHHTGAHCTIREWWI